METRADAVVVKMAELDNLEYYIKFPNPNYNYNQHTNGDSDFVFVVNEEKVPVVILFGWAGSQDKYLSKYSQLYEERGLITLRYSAPVKYLFWKRHKLIPVAEKIVKLLVDMNFDTHPVIVHCFSNGGAFMYKNFLRALDKSPKQIQVKGVIYDSGPGRRRMSSVFKAISAIIGGNMVYNFTATMLLTALLFLVYLCETLKNLVCPSKDNSSIFNYLKEDVNMWPQHFIFSKADDLIPYTDVERFLEHRKNKGVEVTAVCFESSPHVKHYMSHKEMYVSSICNFLNKCLNGKIESTRC